MTSVLAQPSAYLDEFSRNRPGPAWLERLREQAFARFSELGFPTTKQEDWRFTNVAPIARVAFRRAERGVTRSRDRQGAELVFFNGRYSPELSSPSFPDGVRAGSLAAAFDDPEVERQLARYAGFQDHAFVALNTAFLEDGAFVTIGKGVVLEQPIHLVYLSSGADQAISHPRHLLLAGPQSQVSIIESFHGEGGGQYFTNAVTEIVAGPSAVVDHYKLQHETERAFHVSTLQAQLARDTNFTSHSISLGGALVRNDVFAVLSEGTECTLNGFYHVTGSQHVDNHTTIDHARPHGTSHELYKGILDGRAAAVFNGKIIVRQDAQKTDAKQTNKNLVLSEDAVINTKPELQIYADDVRCTHGATIGQIDQEAVFYLQSRGIAKEEARSLLTLAFARDVLDRIKVEPLRERLEQIVFERLARSV